MPEPIRITALQRLCLHDGDGVRTTVFLHGCYLDCPWCCNPETRIGNREYFHHPEKCVRNKGCRSALCGTCDGTSFTPECPWQAFEPTVERIAPDELFEKLVADRPFWKNGGGVTFSGGEALMQARALVPLLERLKRDGIHITFETSAFAPQEHMDTVLPLADHFIVDVKRLDRPIIHPAFDGVPLLFDANFSAIVAAGKLHKLRMVLIRNVTATPENLGRLAALIDRHHIDDVELLQYHALGSAKYEQLDLAAPTFDPLPPDESERIARGLRENAWSPDIRVRSIRL